MEILSKVASASLDLSLNDYYSFGLEAEYRRVVVRAVRLVQEAGYELTSFSELRPSKFSRLASDVQNRIISSLAAFVDTCVAAAEHGASLRGNSVSAAWWVLSSSRLRPLSDVFDKITELDTIEIYNREHVQIFRSFNMFRCLSYSLDELVTHEWFELYSRPKVEEEKVIATFERAMREQVTILDDSGSYHVVSERFSPRLRRARYETRVVSPLFSGPKTVAGYINVIRATPIVEAAAQPLAMM